MERELLTGWLCDGLFLVLVVLVWGYLDSDWSSALAVLYSDSVYFFADTLFWDSKFEHILYCSDVGLLSMLFLRASFEYCSHYFAHCV